MVLKLNLKPSLLNKSRSFSITALLLISLVFVLTSSFFVSANTNLNIPCTSNTDCELIKNTYGYTFQVYCNPIASNPIVSKCFSIDNTTNSNNPSSLNSGSRNLTTSNASLSTSSSSNNLALQASLQAAQSQLSQLTPKISELESSVLNTDARVGTIEADLANIQAQFQELNSNVERLNTAISSLSSGQENLKSELNQNLQVVNTGLAGLQESIVQTQTNVQTLEEAVAERPTVGKLMLYGIAVILIAAGVFGLIYLLRTKQPKKNLPPSVINYITQKIRTGQKFSHIRDELVKAGWDEEDVKWAYKETARHNFSGYQQKTSASNTEKSNVGANLKSEVYYDHVPENRSQKKNKTSQSSSEVLPFLGGLQKNKVLAIIAVSVVLLIGLLLFIRGVSTGQAIHFQSDIELDAAAKSLLENLADENAFYPLVEKTSICIELKDLDRLVSYNLLKINATSHEVKTVKSCTINAASYDLSLRFNDWESYNIILRKPSCESFKSEHKNGMFLLPSKYILPGFAKNPFEDASSFCPVLKTCLSAVELKKIGLNC
ncbi:hypothetical protein J4437_05100 [Candidatus Woesearchaeota archaeon]|nr:hypothetical protein [Candidatus Woesearchaeota archaeon]